MAYRDDASNRIVHQVQHRGPATNIRDSLAGRGGAESSQTSSRSASRDPSPKTGPQRKAESGGPLNYRNESPLRLLSRSGRPSSSGASTAAAAAAAAAAAEKRGVGAGNLGFCLSGIRASGSSSMGAFRSGGPVRAKADVFNGDRRSRPATAPSSRSSGAAARDSAGSGGGSAERGPRGSGSRPASPMGPAHSRSGSQSRPPSPQQRPPSPTAKASSQPPSGSYPLTQLDKSKQRSLSNHMRRAPSPTPAFNRNTSPGKSAQPRWRM